ncbi:MAG: cysteine desulfurase [Parasphingorhabdus sp.]|jgi:cysteine desulfurase
MALNSLTSTRVHHMSRSTGTVLTDRHLTVLEYAWRFYRKNSLGPLYQNIARHTGISKAELIDIFPHGLNSVFTWVGIPIQSKDDGCKAMVSLDVEDLREVYFDHNGTTPLRDEVRDEMIRFLQDSRSYGNASSAYDIGSQAFDVIDQARRRVAAGIGVDPAAIFFTGSGSEANNLALKGIIENHPDGPGHIITTQVEHPSILKVAAYFESQGHDVTYLPVQADGTLSASTVEDAIRADTRAVAIMAANNEIGTIYPIAEIGAICREKGIAFIVDAIQAVGKMPFALKDSGISMLTLSGHKIGAPKGVGAIYVDPSITLAPQIHGGGQESGLRAGTENVLGIHAMGHAVELAVKEITEHCKHLLDLQSYFLEQLEKVAPDAVINGSMEQRLPNNLSVGFKGIDSGSLLLSLNQIGVFVSAGSACSAGNDSYSHVLEAIGTKASDYGTVRFSFGMTNSRADLDYLFEHLPEILEGLK